MGLIIYQENGLFGAKNQNGVVVIPHQYIEMQPFSCGLSLVRNQQYQYAYINMKNELIIPFGTYQWCDPVFVCGFARVIKYDSLSENNKWGIIDTLGNIVVPFEYDKIWAIKEEYIFSITAFVGNKEKKLNLHQIANKVIFDGLTYISIYSVKAFKQLVNCEKLYIKTLPDTNQLFFTYGSNMGFVAIAAVPQKPMIAIVANSSGKIFPLLMEKADIGKTTLSIAQASPKRIITQDTHKTALGNYKIGHMNDINNWNDPYGDEQAFYDGWSKNDVESGLADAYECQ